MKKVLFLMVCLIGISQVNLFAQKPDKTKLNKYSYTQLPNTPLPKEYKTYKVEANSYNSYREDKILGGFNIAGYSKTSGDDADFKISAKEYEILVTDVSQKTEQKTKKVDGVEKKYNEYYYVFKITHKLAVTVLDKDGNKVTEQTLFDDKKEYKSNASSDGKSALEGYKSYRNTLMESLLSDKLSSINSILNDRIGFPVKADYLHIYTVKPKKFNYDDYNEALQVALEGANIVIGDENATEKAKPHFDKAMEIWMKALEESDLNNKKARVNEKVTAVTYYNMGVCAILLKDYENAKKYMQKVNEVDRGFSDATHYVDKMTDLINRVEKNK